MTVASTQILRMPKGWAAHSTQQRGGSGSVGGAEVPISTVGGFATGTQLSSTYLNLSGRRHDVASTQPLLGHLDHLRGARNASRCPGGSQALRAFSRAT